ncbi:DUF4286 family protein [Paraburkholderia sp. SIMBA_049]
MSTMVHGLLAIWSTIQEDVETDYLHWLTREHIFERVSVPGFISGRAYRKRDSAPSEYLIVYTLDDLSVVSSAPYIERLNNPTPWTQRIMPHLQHFRRGGGAMIAQAGHPGAFGSRLAVARCDAPPPKLEQDALNGIAAIDRMTQTWIMTVASDATSIETREKSMRTGAEGIFKGMVAIEALDDAALNQAAHAVQQLTPDDYHFDFYDLIFSFCKRNNLSM